MKPAAVWAFLVGMQLLVSVCLAADQVVHLQQCEAYLWEAVASSCQEFHTDDVACCGALAAFQERGCVCSEWPPEIESWLSVRGHVCDMAITLSKSERCLQSKLTDLKSRSPAHASSSYHGGRRAMQEQVSSQLQGNDSGQDVDDEDAEKGSKKNKTVYPGIMAAGFIGSFLLSCAYACPCWKPKRRVPGMNQDASFKQDISINSLQSSQSLGPSYNSYSNSGGFSNSGSHLPGHPTGGALTFTMAELVKVTGNFSPSHKIGQGGFGTVYKGKLRDGTTVAVKRAKKDAFETRLSVEFQNELEMLSQVDHLNLVKLIGYLEEEHERIIVVEFVPNGNLREHLDGIFGDVLDMATRLDISIDIAHALTYLHLYADRPIIHRDVKASNILLTDTCRAKVADFGFSRMGPTDQGATHVSTQVKGTAGYLDPEYLTTYQLNEKSDVYSFGILLVEIFTGRRPIELKRPSDERVTVRWAFKKFVEGKVLDILDPRLERSPAIHTAMERLAELAFACSAPTKNDRPSMKKAQESLWQIRKEYRGPAGNQSPLHPSYQSSTPQGSGPSQPNRPSHLSRGTFPIAEASIPRHDDISEASTPASANGK